MIVSDCTLVSTSAALKIGTEGVDDFEDIHFHHCVIEDSNRGLSVQIRDGGSVRNVSFSDITVRTRRFADSWWGCAEPIAVTAVDRDENTPCGRIENLRFENIDCEGENGSLLWGQPGKIGDVSLHGVRIALRDTSRWPKHRYDLRPGVGTAVTERRAAGLP